MGYFVDIIILFLLADAQYSSLLENFYLALMFSLLCLASYSSLSLIWLVS